MTQEAVTASRGSGRPSAYTDELAAEIIARLSNGEPLAVICRDEDKPCDDTVRNWASRDEVFSRAIAHARKVGFDVIAHRARLTLRGKTEDEGGESTGDVQRDKAIADFDLKLLAKWDPRRFADRHVLVGGGPDDDPIRHAVDLTNLSDAQLEQLAGLLALAGQKSEAAA